MATSSILGGESAAARASGRDSDALGPSDSSDSGSDVQGERAMPTGADNPGELGAMPLDLDSDSDSMGTGERASAAGDSGRDGADILPDHIVGGDSPETDEPFDAGPSEGVEDIADESDDGTDSADEGATGSRTASSVEGEGSDGGDRGSVESAQSGGRVFLVPSGSIEGALEGTPDDAEGGR